MKKNYAHKWLKRGISLIALSSLLAIVLYAYTTTVNTGGVTDVQTTAATVHGTIGTSYDGTPEVRFHRSTSADFSTALVISDDLYEVGETSYSLPITGLNTQTRYYYKLVVTDDSDTYEGSVENFWTLATQGIRIIDEISSYVSDFDQIEVNVNADLSSPMPNEHYVAFAVPFGDAFDIQNGVAPSAQGYIVGSIDEVSGAFTATFTGLTAGTRYDIKLGSARSNGTNPETYNYQIQINTNRYTLAPEASGNVQDINVNVNHNSISLNWDASDLEDWVGVRVFRGSHTPPPNGGGSPFGTSFYVASGSAQTASFGSLSAATAYDFTFYALNQVDGQAHTNSYVEVGSISDVYTLSTAPTGTIADVEFERTETSITINWASGTLDNYEGLLIIKDSEPTPDNGTAPTASSELVIVNSEDTQTAEFTGLTAATAYDFRFVAFNWDGDNEGTYHYNEVVDFFDIYSLSATPTGTIADEEFIRTETSITINWTAGTLANYEGLLVIKDAEPTPDNGTAPSASSELVIINSSDTQTAGFTGLDDATAFNFRFVAFNWDGANTSTYNYSEVEDFVDVYTLSPLPGGPASGLQLSSDPLSATQFSLLWSAAPSNTAGYLVFTNEGGTPANISAVQNGQAAPPEAIEQTTLNETISGLDPGTQYTITIIPFNRSGTNTATSNYRKVDAISASFYTLAAQPDPVDELVLVDRDEESISISWDKPTNARGYLLYYQEGTTAPTPSGIDNGTSPPSTDLSGVIKVINLGDVDNYEASDLDVLTDYSFTLVPFNFTDNGSAIAATYHYNIASAASLSTSTLCPGITDTDEANSVNLGLNTADLEWTKTTPSNHTLVVVRLAATAAVTPQAGTDYSADANTDITSGGISTTGAGNYVVYAGSDEEVSVSGLTIDTNYAADFYEYDPLTFCYADRLVLPFATNCAGPATNTANVISQGTTTATSIRVDWTITANQHQMVVIREASLSRQKPSQNATYSANQNYNSAAEIGTSGNKVVFRGNSTGGGSNITVTNLQPDTEYTFDFYAYANATNCYNLDDVHIRTATYSTDCNGSPTIADSQADNVDVNTVSISWEEADDDLGVIVIGRLAATANVNPSDGVDLSGLSANTDFSAAPTTSAGHYLLYYAASSSVDNLDITGLLPNTDYVFSVYTFKSNGLCYSAPSQIPASTVCIPPTTATSSNVNDYSISKDGVEISWSNATNDVLIVLREKDGTAQSAPLQGDDYTASNVFMSGDEITGGSANYAVVKSAASGSLQQEIITNLDPETEYVLHFYDFSEATNCYDQSGLTVEFTTACDPPAPAITSVSAEASDFDQIDLTWTNTSDQYVLIIAREPSASAAVPVSGISYVADQESSYAEASAEIGTANYIIYAGNGTNASITNLAAQTLYDIEIFVYDDNNHCYNIDDSFLFEDIETLCEYPSAATFPVDPVSDITTVSMKLAFNIPVDADQILILAKEGSAVDFEPVSGTSYAAGANTDFSSATDINTGNRAVYVGNALSEVELTGLLSLVEYHFALYAFNDDGTCYNLTDPPARISAETGAPSDEVEVTYNAAGSAISSIANTQGDAAFVMSFTLEDEGIDQANVLLDKLTIRKSIDDDFADWTQIIGGAVLIDGDGRSDYTDVDVYTDRIEFSGFDQATNRTGGISNGASKQYELYIWLQETVNASLRETMDGNHFVFEFTPNVDIETNNSSSGISTSDIISTQDTDNELVVSASALTITTQPSTEANAYFGFDTPATVQAVDANGNWSLRFTSTNFQVTNTAGFVQLNTPDHANLSNGSLTTTALSFLNSGLTRIVFTDVTTGYNIQTNEITVNPTLAISSPTNGLNSGTLQSGTENQALIGIGFTYFGSFSFTDFTFQIDEDPDGKVENIRLVSSGTSATYNPAIHATNVVAADPDYNAGELSFESIIGQDFVGSTVTQIQYYFLIADVVETVNEFDTNPLIISFDIDAPVFTNNTYVVNGSDLSDTFDSGDKTYDFQDIIEPEAETVTPNILTLSDSDAAAVQPAFSLTIVFNEEMDTDTDPFISFSPVEVNSSLSFNSGSWTDALTYVALYDFTDENVTITDVEVTIEDAQDKSGNTQFQSIEEDVFNIDTENPEPTVSLDRTTINSIDNELQITISYNKDMDDDFNPSVAVSGSTNFNIPVSGSWNDATTYVITISHDLTEEEIAANEINVSGGRDVVGNIGTTDVSEEFLVDTRLPDISFVGTTNSDGFYTIDDVVSIIVNFSEAVEIVDNPTLDLNTGAEAIYHSGSGTNILRFDYTVSSGENTDALDVIAINLASGEILDLYGNPLDDALPTGNNLADVAEIIINTNVASIQNVTTTKVNGFYSVGEEIEIRLTFDEEVFVVGTPQLSLNSGGIAFYSTGSTTNTLRFMYEVQAGENATPLDYADINSFTAGTVTNIVGIEIERMLPALGGGNSLVDDASIVIDTEAPDLVDIDPLTNALNIPLDQTFSITLDEPFIGTGINNIWLVNAETNSTEATLDASAVFETNPFLASATAGFSFVDDLNDSTDYYILIAPGAITDRAGNPFIGIDEEDWSFQSFGSPRISLLPDASCVGETVEIEGKYFTGVNQIFIGGVDDTEVTTFTVISDQVVSFEVPANVGNNVLTMRKNVGQTDNYATVLSVSDEELIFGPTSASLEVVSNENVCNQGNEIVTQSRIRVNINGGSGVYTVVYNNGEEDITELAYISGTELTVVPPQLGDNEYSLVSVSDNDPVLAICETPDLGAPITITKFERSSVFAGGLDLGEAENVIEICAANTSVIDFSDADIVGQIPNIAGDVTTGVWTIVGGGGSGTGGFSADFSQKTSTDITPVYYAGLFDATQENGILLRLTSDAPSAPNPCATQSSLVRIRFVSSLTISVGQERNLCADYPVASLSASFGGGATGMIWERSDDAPIEIHDPLIWGFSDDGEAPYTETTTNRDAFYRMSPAEIANNIAVLKATPTTTGDACGDSDVSRELNINLRANPLISPSVADLIVCSGQDLVRYQVNPSPGADDKTYIWSIDNLGVNDPELNRIVGPGNSNQIFINFGSGSAIVGTNMITVQEIRLTDGCVSNVVSFEVEVQAAPDVEIYEPDGVSVFASSAGLIPLRGRGGQTGNLQDGGSFSGPGVIVNRQGDYFFDAGNVGVNDINDPNDFYVITYSYVDSEGCSNSTTVNYTVFDAETAIENLKATYCVGDLPDTVSVNTALIPDGREVVDIYGSGVTYLGDNLAIFDPTQADTDDPDEFEKAIRYSYAAPDGTSLVTDQGPQLTVVTPIPQLFFNTPSAQRFSTANATLVPLTKNNVSNPGNNFEFFVSDSLAALADVVTGDNLNGFFFNPAALANLIEIDDYADYAIEIFYSYQDANSCRDTDSFSLIVNRNPAKPNVLETDDSKVYCITDGQLPIVSIDAIDHPSTAVRWYNNAALIGSPIALSNEFSPSAAQLNLNQIARTTFYVVQNVNGFDSPIDSVIFEVLLPPQFDWSTSYLDGQPIQLIADEPGIEVNALIWEVSDTEGNLVYTETITNPQFTEGINDAAAFTPAQGGNYFIELTISTDGGCSISNTANAAIVEQVNLSGNLLENFNNSNANWAVDGENVSWAWGALGNKAAISAEDGDRVWATALSGTYNAEETSYLISAKYDISTIDKPFIAFDLWYNTLQNDGLVLQYSVDDKNLQDPTKEWIVLGQTNSGNNWYNRQGVTSQVRVQTFDQFAWTDNSQEWVNARHILDEVKVAAAGNGVVFRLAFTSNQNITLSDGVAVNNFQIGERNRNVLVEFFANTNVAASATLAANIEQRRLAGDQIVVLRYHPAMPADDAFSGITDLFAGSRAVFYGASTANAIPSLGIDGHLALGTTAWQAAIYNSRTLINSPLNINMNASVDDDVLHLTVNLDMLGEVPANSVLHVALVEREIAKSTLGEVAANASEDVFRHVVKRMLPDARGTKINDPLARGASSGPYSFSYRVDHHINDPSQLAVVVFLQDEESKEIYQSELFASLPDLPVVSSAAKAFGGVSKVDLFPNPARDKAFIRFDKNTDEDLELHVVNMMGRIMHEQKLAAGQNHYEVDTKGLENGMFMLRIQNKKGDMVSMKLIVSR